MADAQKAFTGPWPWYILLITGFAISGFFPWLMVSWAVYQRRQRRTALLAFGLNVAIFCIWSWGLLRLPVVWWLLVVLTYGVNIVWGVAAWLFQRKMLGAAPKRYILKAWKTWIIPIIFGILLGGCIGTVFSIIPAMESRGEMWGMGETLERETILWSFFSYTPWGALAGVLLGLWWAGEGDRFRASHLITFLPALMLTIIFWIWLVLFLFFLVHKGTMPGLYALGSSYWAVVPPWISGFRKIILQGHTLDISAIVVVPLLFGAVSRIRDFCKRALLIPLAFLCLLPRIFSENTWWNGIQDQIFYEMSSPNANTQAAAHRWAALLLKRYPQHLQWPQIAEQLARYYYEQGEYEQARVLYQQIIKQYGGTNQWYWTHQRAQNALNNAEFGTSPSGPNLDVPVVDYEEYLSAEWMTLLSVIRYWEGTDTPESELKIKLKDLSSQEDMIDLSSLGSLVDLDDAAHSLGYEVCLLAADIDRVKSLIAAGFPIIHQRYRSLYLIWGFDESRSVVSVYDFENLSSRLRREAPKEAREILELEEEGQGESQKRLVRIAHEAYDEHAIAFWESPVLRYTAPLMALVFPAEKGESLAATLNTSWLELKKESDGYLATLISLAYILEGADAVQAVEWAKAGAAKLTDPLPLYAASLAERFWQSRADRIKSALPLQEQFPELADIFAFFSDPDTRAFLEQARQQFEQDLLAETIPSQILLIYRQTLERSDPDELALLIRLIRENLALDPKHYYSWYVLANLYEWDGDVRGMVEALTGHVSAYPMDYEAKLRLAYGHVLLEQYAEAQAVLNTLEVDGRIAYNADYSFCLGAIAEWEGNLKQARQYYAQAVEMRRYKPIYHLKYGKLLLQEGESEAARKALEWAAKIDGGEAIKQEAERLLSQL